MPGSHWMLALSPENWQVSRSRTLDVIGVRQRHRRKAERMAPGDRVLVYVTHQRVFTATATITSTFFEDHSPLWRVPTAAKGDDFPYRVHTEPNMLLEPDEYIDAYALAPRLLYVKRWPPEDWPLAFHGDIHLLSSIDFGLIEGELGRIINARHRGVRDPGPSSGPDGSVEPVASKMGQC